MIDASEVLLGVEGRHLWVTLDTNAALVTLNDLSAWPRFAIEDLQGYYDLPSADEHAFPNNEAPGETDYPSYYRGKPVGYTMRVYGRTRLECIQGGQALRDAFGPDAQGRKVKQRMVVEAHPGYGSGQRCFVARPTSLRVDDHVRTGPPSQQAPGPGDGTGGIAPYTLQADLALYLYDARHFAWDGDTETATDPKY